jgi:hypothetical protein
MGTQASRLFGGGGGGGGISQLSQAVIGYSTTPGANYADENFVSAIRAINEYNNALVTSKQYESNRVQHEAR